MIRILFLFTVLSLWEWGFISNLHFFYYCFRVLINNFIMNRQCYLFFFSFLLFYACSVDEHPKDQIEEEKVYTSEKSIYQNVIEPIYSLIGGNVDGQGLQGTCRGVYDLQTFASDEALLPTRGVDWFDGGLWQDLFKHSWTSGHEVVKNSWMYLFKVITLCNRAIETIEKHKDIMTEVIFKRDIAELKAIRGVFFFYLLDLFGNVPYVEKSNMPLSEVTQLTRSNLFKMIIDDMSQSMPYLPNRMSQQKGDYYGHVTLPVAIFVLAKLYLNAEVYTDDVWTDDKRPDGGSMEFIINNKKMNAWEATVYYCDLIEQMHYKLEADYSNNFFVNNHYSNENIWTIPLDQYMFSNEQQNIVRSLHSRHAASNGFSGENGTSASLTVLEVNGFGTPQQDSRFDLNYWGDVATDYNGLIVKDRNGKPLQYLPQAIQMDLNDSPYLEMAGARMKKYEVDADASNGGKLMDNDIVLFRFADVLLMKAEALVRNGQSGQKEFDMIRERAGMPLKTATLGNIYDERLIELAWEGWRRNDMIRFDKYKSLYDGADAVNENDYHTIVFPIPEVVVTLNNNISQNPGY